MRKCFLFLINLSLCSCIMDKEQYRAKIEHDFVKDVVEIEYKGHTYLRYHSDGGQCAVGGICHSASCHCYANKQNNNLEKYGTYPDTTITIKNGVRDTSITYKMYEKKNN